MNPGTRGYAEHYPVPRFAVVVAWLLAAGGVHLADTWQLAVAYLLIMLASILPGLLWIRQGAPGLPVLPIVTLAYVPYAALPIATGNPALLAYSHAEVVRAAATVCLFLVTATIAWQALSRGQSSTPVGGLTPMQGTTVVPLVLAGLLLGLVYQFSVASGSVDWGSFKGLVRSVALTFATIACLFTGVTRGQGFFRGGAWAAAVVAIAALVLVAWSSLFLVDGIIYLSAVAFGYVIVARRVPMVAAGAIAAVVVILHAGKGEMRARYWEHGLNHGDAVSLAQLPEFGAEWIAEGLKALVSDDEKQSPLQRASILQYVLLAQTTTPDTVDYLMGETYANLASILVPRFLDPDKPASQVSMDLLNVRYGVLTEEGAESTAAGWGLIAEGYANFGYIGVVGVALLLGAFCAALANWSHGADLASPSIWMSAAAMMALIRLEADFISVVLPLLQSFGAVLMVYAVFKLALSRQHAEVADPAEPKARAAADHPIRHYPRETQ